MNSKNLTEPEPFHTFAMWYYSVLADVGAAGVLFASMLPMCLALALAAVCA